MLNEIETIKTEVNNTRKAIGSVIHLLEKINSAMEAVLKK
jgi:hypothetical protein